MRGRVFRGILPRVTVTNGNGNDDRDRESGGSQLKSPLHALFAQGDPPAGGAPTEDLIPALIAGVLLLAGAVWFALRHRSGRTRLLSNGAAFAARVSGMPGWAALPAGITGVSLLIAVYGFYWDVATHIDNGRDPGPFANPAHYLIIIGLLGIALAGAVGLLLGEQNDRRPSLPFTNGWSASVGSALLLVCGVIAVLGFPLDDVWHRLFGQDVTLWGPTHLQMVGGAALSTLALWILLIEADRARIASGATEAPRAQRLGEVLVAGAFLVGLSTFQGEFDYSVPQFRLLFHPVLLMLAASIALVPARIRLGRGGAIKAVLVFLGLRGVLSLVIGPGLDHTLLHFPLYLGGGLAVELVALRVSTERQISFGAWAGTGIGVLGLATEWAWSHVFMTMSWPAELFPQAIIMGMLAALSGGVLGGFIGRAFAAPGAARQRPRRFAGPLAAAGIITALVIPLPIGADIASSADVTLATPEGESSHITVGFHDGEAPKDATWLNVTSWQGGGSVVSRLEPAGDGLYETETAVPITGQWKTLIRLHKGDSIVALPIYMPEDPAISAPEVPADASFTRAFVQDKELLLREALESPSWLSWSANAILLLIVGSWMGALGWGLRRLDEEGGADLGRREGRARV